MQILQGTTGSTRSRAKDAISMYGTALPLTVKSHENEMESTSVAADVT